MSPGTKEAVTCQWGVAPWACPIYLHEAHVEDAEHHAAAQVGKVLLGEIPLWKLLCDN